MKKYWISKSYVSLYLALIVLLLLSSLVVILPAPRIVREEGVSWGSFIRLWSVWGIGILAILYSILFDFHGGKYAIDANGIRIYVGLKCYKHPWESLAYCGIVDVDVGSVTNEVETYWVYFANRKLTVKERTAFLRKTRRDLVNIAFFQYEHEPFELALQYAPEHLRTQLEALPRPQKWKRSPVALRKR